MSQSSTTKLTIATSSIIKLLAILAAVYFLFLIKNVLALLFVSLVLASAINPWVKTLKKHGWPRLLSMILIYVVLILFVGAVVYLLIPPLAEQFVDLGNNLPTYSEKLRALVEAMQNYSTSHGLANNFAQAVDSISSGFVGLTGQALTALYNVFSGIFSILLVLVFTFYMIVEEEAIKKLVRLLSPKHQEDYVIGLVDRMEDKIGLWLRGQLFLCLIIFVAVYIGLTILGVKYALLLALIAGITEAIPYLGPILGAVPTILLTVVQSPTLALLAAALFLIIQQTENNLLVPLVMKKAVGMNPIISISVLMIGFTVGGVVGALLSIPVTTALSVLVEDLLEKKNRVQAAKNKV